MDIYTYNSTSLNVLPEALALFCLVSPIPCFVLSTGVRGLGGNPEAHKAEEAMETANHHQTTKG